MLGKAGRCGLIVMALLWGGAVSTGAAVADVTDQSVAYQVDPAHDGWLRGVMLPTPLQAGWADTFGGDVSYPLVVNGTVYVTALPPGGGDSDLFAMNQATGGILWQHDLGSGYSWSGLAYDDGRVFAVNSGGLLTTFDAVTGTIDWSSQLPGQYAFSSPPTAVGGIVYDGGAGDGGTLYANDEATGALLWSRSVANGDNSSPAVDGSNVYVTYPDNYYAFDRVTGALKWLDASGGDGGGGRTPVVADGHVFIRDWVAPARIVSATDGALQAPLGSTTVPAVANGIAYELDGSMLEAVPEDGLGPIAWTFSGDGQLDTAPLVIGSTVFVGSYSGELYALDGATGQQLWSTNVHSAILAPDEQNVSEPLTGLGAGGDSVFVSAGPTLVAYTAPDAVLAPVNHALPGIQGQLGVGEQLSADAGDWLNSPFSFRYVWQRCDAAGAACGAIGGDATTANYVVQAGDVGSTLRVVVTATNAAGDGPPATSAPTDVVAVAPGPATGSIAATSGPSLPNPGGSIPSPVRSIQGSSGAATGAPNPIVAQAAALRTAISPRTSMRRMMARHGVQLTVAAPAAGRMVIEWLYAPAGATRPVLLALGRVAFGGAGSQSVKLHLTPAGARALSRARAGAWILALAEFVPAHGKPIVVQTEFRLRR